MVVRVSVVHPPGPVADGELQLSLPSITKTLDHTSLAWERIKVHNSKHGFC